MGTTPPRNDNSSPKLEIDFPIAHFREPDMMAKHWCWLRSKYIQK